MLVPKGRNKNPENPHNRPFKNRFFQSRFPLTLTDPRKKKRVTFHKIPVVQKRDPYFRVYEIIPQPNCRSIIP